MSVTASPELEEFRAELVDFLEAHAPPEALGGRDWIGTESADIPEWAVRWQATLFDHGWMVPGYPPELGGRNATPLQTLVYQEVLSARGIPRSVHFGGYAIVGPSLLEFGNDEQRALAPAAIRGDTVWCVGMSEPDAGSDLANLHTRAVEDGDSFVVTGQKVWTSYAMVAQKCFCYVRTDPTVAKHKGISVLILDMDLPGIEVRPLRHLTGAAEFAEVFLDDVVVPKANLVGELNGGWRITMGSLAHERGGLWLEGVAGAQRAVDGLIAIARRRGLDDDPVVRRRLAELYAEVRSLRALGYKGFASYAQGSSAPEHSFMKLATSELRQRLYELGMDLQGPYATVVDPELAEESGRWQHSWQISLAATIGGGTSEIQRNVVATRVLGLPPGMSDFALSDEQQMLRDTARALFTKECPSSLVRGAFYDVTETGPADARALFDDHLRDWLALADGSLVDLCLFLEEAGAAVAPGPTWVSASFFAPLVAGDGDGEVAGTVAMAGRDGQWVVNDESTKWFVPHLEEVERIAFVLPGPSLVVVDADAVAARRIETLDPSRPLFAVEVPAAVGGARPLDEAALSAAVDRATVALSAELIGVGRWLQETTLAYVRDRVQFDKPVGSFQGLQWKLVDAALLLERATAAVHYAAMCVDAGDPDQASAVHVAKACAGEAARRWARDGLQAHGGVGYTWDHDLHLRLRRAYGGDHLLGDAGWHHDRIADLIF